MKLEAIERLVELVEEDTGAAEAGTGWKDDESVGWAGGGAILPMTFGDVRRARAELEELKKIMRRN
jgi:hypothetical protein